MAAGCSRHLIRGEISEEKEPEYYPSVISGKDLLRIISLVDQIEIDGTPYAINRNGTRFDDEEYPQPKPKELVKILLCSTKSNPDK